MGLEFEIESYDVSRVELPEYFAQLHEFQYQADGLYYFGTEPSAPVLWVKLRDCKVFITQHNVSRETDALIFAIIRRVLTINDHVVIAER